MSGVYGPSFAFDWVSRIPQWWLIRPKMLAGLRKDGANVRSFAGFFDLRTREMGLFRQKIKKQPLPRDVLYLNVVGARGDDGLASDPAVSTVQNKLIRKQLSGYGANDGYIEYPGTMFPEDWAPHVVTAVVDGSHALIDGTLGGAWRLNVESDSRRVAVALLGALIDRMGVVR
jgi:hypothetical protein